MMFEGNRFTEIRTYESWFSVDVDEQKPHSVGESRY